MRLCVLSDGYPPWERGGAQKIAAQLAAGYADRGHAVDVLTTVSDRADEGVSTVDGVRVHRRWCPRLRSALPYLTLHNPLVVGWVRRRLRDLDPDAVHAHNAHYLSNGALRAAADVAPVAKTFHDAGTVAYGDFTEFRASDLPDHPEPIPSDAYRVDPWRQFRSQGPRYLPPRNALNRRCIARTVDAGVAVSRELRRALVANGIECFEAIHNGVDAAAVRADADPEAFRAERGLGDAPLVLFGGRTGYEKGGAHLARAFRRAAAGGDARLVVTGDDGYVPRMRALAGPRGDRIESTGWLSRTELHGALAAATVVATPSLMFDPFPTLNLEAFAAGTPVVTTRFGGASELVEDGRDGVVVDPREVDRLADALSRFLRDPALAERFGERGREKVEDTFAVDRQVDAYLDVLGRFAATDGGRPDAVIDG